MFVGVEGVTITFNIIIVYVPIYKVHDKIQIK